MHPFPWVFDNMAQVPRPSMRDPDRYIVPHKCPAGQYQGQQGESHCMGCPAGQFQPEAGASFCTPCAVGTFRDYALRSCDASLGFGLGSGARDDQFSASSSSQGSAVARLGGASAWCAEADAAGRPWLQLNLVNASRVHRLKLEAHPSNAAECVTSFKVLH